MFTFFKSVLLLAGFVCAYPNMASAKDAIGLSAGQTAHIKKAQNYLNKMTTVETRFIQATSRGSFSKGKMWISVPGRMRIDYDPPVEVIIISDGDTVLFKDEDLDQLSYTAFDATPASVLLSGGVDFFGPGLLLTDFEKTDDVMRITSVRENDPSEGSFTMVFSTKPMRLIKWMVVDAQGIVTTVSLMNPEFGGGIDGKLFKVEQRIKQKKQD